MKKSKLLILLPLIALSMSSCDMSLTAGQSGFNNRSSSSEEVNEPSSYSSYLVEYGLHYDGNLESVPEGASLYLYGSLVRDSFTPLTVNEEGHYQTTIYDIEYGTYEYSLYIEYTDKEVSLESPLVYSDVETVNGNSSSGGDKNITLNSSLSALLGEKEDEGSGEEDITYTYTIEVDNSDALANLTYDGNAQTQTSVDLQVYLVTTGSDGSSTRQEASADDVSIATTGYDVISISGLTVTVVGAGTTTLTISATDYTSTTINVIVTDVTDPGTGGDSGNPGAEQTTTIDNYTIIFTLYDSNNTVQTCPDNGSLYIQSNFGGAWTEDVDGNGWYAWGNWEALTESKTAENTTYSITVNNLIPGVYYECNIIFVPTGDNASDDWANLVQADGQNIGVTISSTATDGGSQNVDVTGCYTLEQQYGSLSGTTDGGKPNATYIHDFTLVVTIYGSDGTTVKKAPDGYDLYIAGDMDGKWAVNENYDGNEENGAEGWYTWGDLVKLEETTDENGNLAYTYTFGYVEANSSPSYNIYYIETNSEVDWDNKLGSENFYFNVDSGTTDNHTQYVTCSIDSDLDSFMENAVDTGDTGTGGDDQGQGGDTGTVTELTNYTLSFTLTYDGATDSVPEGMELRIIGSWDNDENWNNYHVLNHVGDTYQYTIDSIAVLGEEDQWYNYDLLLGYPNDTSINWDYQLKFTEGTYTVFTVTGSEGDSYTNSISLPLSSPMSSLIYSTISEYTLTLNIYYGDNLESLPTWADLYINGTWANNDQIGWDHFEQLTPDEARTSFTLTLSDIEPGYYEYSLVMVQAGEVPNSGWSNIHRITPESSNGYFEIVSGTTAGTFSYTTSTALEDIYGDPDAETAYTNHVISITLTDTSGNAISVPSWVSVYALFSFDDWTTHDLTRVNDNTFTYTVASITSGNYNYTIDVDYTGGELQWGNHQLANGVQFTIEKNDADNQTDITLKTSLDFTTEFPEPGSTGGDESSSGSVSVYFLIIDTSNATNTSSIDWCFNFTYDASAGEGIFKQNGDTSDDGPWYNWSNATGTTGTINGVTHVAVYNETPGEMAVGEEVWMNLKNLNSNNDVWQSYYFGCTVPTGCGDAVTFVGYANLAAFTSEITNTFSSEVTMTAYAGTPTTVLASL